MEKLLLYIKHNLKFLWRIIEFFNSLLLNIVHRKKITTIKQNYSDYIDTNNGFQFRLITSEDLDRLYSLLSKLDKHYVKYFNPHAFDRESLKYVLKSNNFLTFGYFHNKKLVGYFMLRLFANSKAFTSRVVDSDFSGRGIGKDMAKIMYRMANELDWGVFATISEENIASLKTHNYKVVKKLPNGYILIKFNTKDTNW